MTKAVNLTCFFLCSKILSCIPAAPFGSNPRMTIQLPKARSMQLSIVQVKQSQNHLGYSSHPNVAGCTSPCRHLWLENASAVWLRCISNTASVSQVLVFSFWPFFGVGILPEVARVLSLEGGLITRDPFRPYCTRTKPSSQSYVASQSVQVCNEPFRQSLSNLLSAHLNRSCSYTWLSAWLPPIAVGPVAWTKGGQVFCKLFQEFISVAHDFVLCR